MSASGFANVSRNKESSFHEMSLSTYAIAQSTVVRLNRKTIDTCTRGNTFLSLIHCKSIKRVENVRLRFNFIESLKEVSDAAVYRLAAALLLVCLLTVELYC